MICNFEIVICTWSSVLVSEMSWNLRVRGPGGQATLAASADTAVSELQQQITQKLGVPAYLQELLGGFPPKLLQVRHDMVAQFMLAALHVHHSATINARIDCFHL